MSEKKNDALKTAINEKVVQPEEKKQGIGLGEKLGFMSFSTSSNIVFNFKNVFYLFFLTEVLKISPAIAGVMTAIGTIWDAINDPLISLFCTNHKFKSGERIRPYALYMCVPWAITLVLLFVNFKVGTLGSVIIGILVYILFETFYTFLCMPYNSMGSLATKNDGERKSINSFRSLGTCLGSAIGALCIQPLVKLLGGDPQGKWTEKDSMPIFYTALIMGCLCIIGSLIHYFTTKERIKPSESDSNEEEKIGLIEAYKCLFRCKSWVLNLCYVMCYAIVLAFVMNSINYFASDVLIDAADKFPLPVTTTVLACYLVCAIVMSLLTPKLDKKIGRRKMMIISIVVLLITEVPFIIFSFIPNFFHNNVFLAVILMGINALGLGFGLTVCFIMFNTNRNNISDVIEIQTGKRMDTMIAGGDNLINKLAEALAIFAMTQIFEATGTKIAGEVVLKPIAVNLFLGLIPAIFVVLMLFPAFKINIPKELKEAQEFYSRTSKHITMTKTFIEGKTLDEYKKTYSYRIDKLKKYTIEEVKKADEEYIKEKSKNKNKPIKVTNHLLRNRDWWLIDNTYYQVPTILTLSWFLNLKNKKQLNK